MPKSNVRRINGIEITGTPVAGDIPVATSATAATWTSGSGSAACVILAPDALRRNLIQPTSPHYVPLTLKGKLGQDVELLRCEDSTGALLALIDYDGGINGDHGYFSTTGSLVDALTASSSTGYGVYATSNFGAAIGAASSQKESAIFRSSSAANTYTTVVIRQRGASAVHLLDFKDDAGSVLSYVDSSGVFNGALTGAASALKSATTTIDVSAATAPSTGQVLTATDSTHATWQTASGYTSLSHAGITSYYATLALAKAAAVSGDAVTAYPGTYNEKDLLKDGVSYNFLPGAQVYYTGSSNGAIFDDGATGANGAVTCTIAGAGDFKRAGSGSTNHVFNIANASTITFSCARVWSASSGGYGVYQSAGTVTGTMQEFKTDAGSSGAYVSGVNSVQELRTVRVNAGGTSNFLRGDSGKQTLAADDIIDAFSFYGHGATQHISFLRYATPTGSGATARFNCDGGTQVVTGQAMDAGGDVAALCAGGTQEVRIGSATGSGDIYSCSSGSQLVESGTATTSGAAKYAVTGSGGTQRIKNLRAVNSDANGVAANAGGQALVLDGACTLLSGASATDSLTAGSAQNVKVYGTVVGNKALNANVTIQVGRAIFSDSNVT